MNHLVKISVVITGVFLGLVILLWLGAAAYFSINKKEVLQKLTHQLNENINGKLTIESMEPSLIKGFPGVSVSLKNVLLRDSLYETHHHNLLQAKDAFITVGTWSIITGNLQMQNIIINNGEIYVYTDSSGYSNTRIFKTLKAGENKSGSKFNRIQLNNVKVTLENRNKSKLFSFSVIKLDNKIKHRPNSWIARTSFKLKVNALIFNMVKGSYLRNKLLTGRLKLEYSHKTHVLTVPLQDMLFDNDRLHLGGTFSFRPNSSAFVLNIKAPAIKYINVLTLLTPRIASKLKLYNIDRPFYTEASIRGRLKGKNIPIINIRWKVNKSAIKLWDEKIENTSLTGFFTNEVEKGKPRLDPNSAISIYQLSSNWRGINFNADTIRVVNLKNPIFQGKFKSSFSLAKLNAVSGSETFFINKGKADLNLLYRAPLNPLDSVEPYIYGKVQITGGELIYVPRNLRFKEVNGIINFRGQHLLLQEFRVQSGSSKLYMQGSIRNFVNFYYTNPQRILFDWRIQSPQINLGEFLTFLGTRRTAKYYTRPRNRVSRIFKQLNNVLGEANVNLDLKAERLLYRKFDGSDLSSNLTLRQSGININNVSLRHGGGTLNVVGSINQGSSLNNFSVDSHLNNVDIKKLFYAFEDFGQTGISHQNLRGILTADTRIRGILKSNGQTVPKSFYGSVKFDLRNGALINFEPMEKIGSFAFRKRDFSNITFRNLHNTLTIQGNKIYIPQMTIQSSVLNMIVEGVYGIPTGTNIGLTVPIRNPEKDKFLSDSLKETRIKRGIVIYLNAVDDENGGVKIKLGKPKDEDEKKQDDQKKNKEKIHLVPTIVDK